MVICRKRLDTEQYIAYADMRDFHEQISNTEGKHSYFVFLIAYLQYYNNLLHEKRLTLRLRSEIRNG